MYLDISRDRHRPDDGVLRIKYPQGSVPTDADLNEEADLVHDWLVRMAIDSFGPAWGPFFDDNNHVKNNGFAIAPNADKTDLTIAAGRYSVGGLPCVASRDDLTYKHQPDYLLTADEIKAPLPRNSDGSAIPYLVYLDAWVRDVNEFEDPTLIDPAFRRYRPAARGRLVWQVRLLPATDPNSALNVTAELQAFITKIVAATRDWRAEWTAFVNLLAAAKLDPYPGSGQPPMLAAFAAGPEEECEPPDGLSYRGPENQLYRVEIHDPGDLATATFKWSRDNGSVVFGVVGKPTATGKKLRVALTSLGPDEVSGLVPDGWVELLDRRSALEGGHGYLLKLVDIDRAETSVTLDGWEEDRDPGDLSWDYAVLRRWDYTIRRDLTTDPNARALPLVPEAVKKDQSVQDDSRYWVELEDGVKVWFDPHGTYRTGDYWLIPARYVTKGLLDWDPAKAGDRTLKGAYAKPASRVRHAYAPLLVMGTDGTPHDCRWMVDPKVVITPFSSVSQGPLP